MAENPNDAQVSFTIEELWIGRHAFVKALGTSSFTQDVHTLRTIHTNNNVF